MNYDLGSVNILPGQLFVCLKTQPQPLISLPPSLPKLPYLSSPPLTPSSQLSSREKELDASRSEVQGLVATLEGSMAGDKEDLKREAVRLQREAARMDAMQAAVISDMQDLRMQVGGKGRGRGSICTSPPNSPGLPGISESPSGCRWGEGRVPALRTRPPPRLPGLF